MGGIGETKKMRKKRSARNRRGKKGKIGYFISVTESIEVTLACITKLCSNTI